MDRDSDRGDDARTVNFADDDQLIGFADDDQPVLPDQTRDDTDRGWGEESSDNDRRLQDERPPHWE